MKADDSLFAMLSHYEAMIETRDDVTDVEEDERRNSFNVLLMLARVHGRSKARDVLIARCHKLESKYKHALSRVPANIRARHEHLVRNEKGGMWLWESIIPHLGAAPPQPKKEEKPMVVEDSALVWTLSDARKATAVLKHTWTVMRALFPRALPPRLPIQGHVLLAALRAARPSSETQLLADGAKYLRLLRGLPARMQPEEVWRLCRWRAFDTLHVAEAICSTYMISFSDTLRALILTFDLQVCLAADLTEFRITSIRDAGTGAVTLCTLEEDTRQLNAALTWHKHVDQTNVETAIQSQIEALHGECKILLQEVGHMQSMLEYDKARAELVKV